MKTLKLSLTLFWLINSLFSMDAFDYQTVYSHRIAFFDHKAIRIDSVKIEGNDSIFYPIKSIREQDYGCYTPYGASFLGEKIVINDQWNYFFNGRGDTIKIKTDAVLNESFELFHTENSDSAIATVISCEIQEFFGLIDSVKTIKVEIFDNEGNPIKHPYIKEDSVMQISKNYGFLKTFDFYDFYFRSDTAHENYLLLGLTNPNVGQQNLTWFEVFDFQPGDELHSIENVFDGYSYPVHRKISTVEKYQSRTNHGNDSISYEVLITKHHYSKSYITGEITESTSSQNENFVFRANPDFDRLNDEPIIHFDYGHGVAYAIRGSSSVKSTKIGIPIETYGNDECWFTPVVDDCSSTSDYYRGLGGPYYEYYESCFGGSTYEKKLVYYKKGDETWGSPLVITGINQVLEKEKNLIIHNPVKEIISLNKEMILHPCLFELFDLNGRILLQKTVNTNNNTVNIHHIQNGVYIYRLIKNKEVLYKGKVIKQ